MLTPRHISIRFKIAMGYILIICCLGAAVIAVTERIQSLQREIETITTRDMDIHNLITSIRYNVINMETSQRGYLLTGDENYLQPYTESKAEWEDNLNRLSSFFVNDTEKRKDLDNIRATIQHWIEASGEPTIALKRENQTEAIIDYFKTDPGKEDVDQLREHLEQLRLKHLASNRVYIEKLDKRNELLTFSLIGILIAVAVVSFFIVAYVSNAIVRTIRQVSSTITEIADSRGDLTKRINVTSKDEIKDLANATNVLLESLEAQSWVQKHVAEVATMNHGVNDLRQLAASFLSKVAPMIGASYGVFYYRRGTGENVRLDKLSAYAAVGEEKAKDSFRFGEGLVGQCAQDKRPFLLNQPEPEHYNASITTGLTELQPRSVLVIPVEFEDKVIAVIEFASLEPFLAQHLKLLEAIEDHFGVAIDNVAGRMEVERLLGESQAMTEELQAQTEELQAQSEELQMQQEEMRMTTEHLEEQNLYAEQKTKELEQAKAELEEYAEKLRQSAQYKTNFLANMSHELRTPLNSILILSQMLYENDGKSLSSEEEGYARVIYSSGNDLLALIDDILDLSKIEAGKLTLVVDEVNVSEIPEMLKLSFDPVAEKRGLTFLIEQQRVLPPIIRTDGQRLQQILKNLLSNAFKFTESGTVTLKLHQADPAIIQERLPGADTDSFIAFAVIDTGIGIPKDKQELIFEAFQQVDGNTNRIYGGTGLGLSICSEFAHLLGGCIVVDSEPHKGSTFTLYLPYQIDEAQLELHQAWLEAASSSMGSPARQAELIAPPIDISGSEVPAHSHEVRSEHPEGNSTILNKRVLLVEDDARNVFAIVRALETKGLEVTVARNGQECMEIIDTDANYDLVLMDIMMPVMDGFETTKALRKHPLMKNTPIIALTAKAMKSDQESCLAAGASDYISKPIQMEQLFSLMRVWLTKQVEH
ncbi:CHASE3 domain-containing protein [Paenibacillus paeoniae]|uniref:Circadian input-output histidine kinase CikA n=1 Tax=Paenibacillus paeoniae TaxID=2292705 RepID=A0A371P5T7_9BACL|nr:CHASE3 domain-containing protein [Paenibacillus paeoniae]REK71259.1 response regulator [Paenibacillus paeoniae]